MNLQPKFTDSYGKPLVKRYKKPRPLSQWQKFFLGLATATVMPFLAFAAVTQIELTTQVKGILPSANGGTGIAFFTVAGPSTTAKTFTFPNANATILTSNAAVTVAQGGTGVGTLTNHAVLLGQGTSNVSSVGPGTTGQCLTGNTGADPTFGSCSGVTNVYSEVPSGTINGSNVTFTLANTPTSGSVGLYKNGQRQAVGGSADYTISGATITYLAAPITGDTLLADYTH